MYHTEVVQVTLREGVYMSFEVLVISRLMCYHTRLGQSFTIQQIQVRLILANPDYQKRFEEFLSCESMYEGRKCISIAQRHITHFFEHATLSASYLIAAHTRLLDRRPPDSINPILELQMCNRVCICIFAYVIFKHEYVSLPLAHT